MSTQIIRTIRRIFKSGLLSLVAAAESVAQNKFGASVAMALFPTQSGQIRQVSLYATEVGAGDIEDSAGVLYIFDADPSVSAGDANLTPSAHKMVIGTVDVGAGDWTVDTSGGVASELMCCHPVYFDEVDALYFAFKNEDANAIGADEVLDLYVHYERTEKTYKA